MKAIQIEHYGDADELKIHEIDRPSPKDNEILVRIFDAGVNPFDWKVRRGFMKDVMPLRFPHTMGYDFAGEVAEVGANVTDFEKGDRVFGFARGAYAEYGITTADRIAEIPIGVSFEVAASLPTPALTGYQLVANEVRPRGASEVLIHGAAGAVGSIAVQVAKSFGLRVYANAAKEDEFYLRELGAERIVDFESQKFEDVFHDLDAVIDLVGGQTLERSFACVKRGGFIVSTVGRAPKELAERREIEAMYYMNKQNANDLAAIIQLVADGKLNVRISEVLPLEKAAEAQRLNETGKSHGKVILQVH